MRRTLLSSVCALERQEACHHAIEKEAHVGKPTLIIRPPSALAARRQASDEAQGPATVTLMRAQQPGFPRGLLRRSKRAHLAYLATYTIGHAIIVDALDAVLHAITQPIDTWTPVILVIGPAGVGKTTLIRAVEPSSVPVGHAITRCQDSIPIVDMHAWYIATGGGYMEDKKDNLVRYVLFRIYGEELEPSEVTARLGIEPSYAHRPGERRDRTGRPRPNGMWQISSEHHVEPHELEEHVSWILDHLEPLWWGAGAGSQRACRMASHGTCADATGHPDLTSGMPPACPGSAPDTNS